jgi:hypothetical protein
MPGYSATPVFGQQKSVPVMDTPLAVLICLVFLTAVPFFESASGADRHVTTFRAFMVGGRTVAVVPVA